MDLNFTLEFREQLNPFTAQILKLGQTKHVMPATKCTKIDNARAQLLFCSLNFLFSEFSVPVSVVVCLSSLIYADVTTFEMLVLFYDWLISIVISSGTSRGFAEHGASSPSQTWRKFFWRVVYFLNWCSFCVTGRSFSSTTRIILSSICFRFKLYFEKKK